MADPITSAAEAIEAPTDFLHQLRRINTERYDAWAEGADAGIMFDALELGGEVGELLNVVKKLEREERGWRGSRAGEQDFADECADVLICLDKLARRRGVDLISATVAKFNATSDKVGLPHKLALSTRLSEPEQSALERAREAINLSIIAMDADLKSELDSACLKDDEGEPIRETIDEGAITWIERKEKALSACREALAALSLPDDEREAGR